MSQGSDLIKLQETDLELDRERKTLKDLPLIAELAKKRASYAKLKSEATRLLADRKDAQIAVDDLDEAERSCHEAITAAQERPIDASDYRAVRDLEEELSLLAKRLDKIAFDRPAALEKRPRVRPVAPRRARRGGQPALWRHAPSAPHPLVPGSRRRLFRPGRGGEPGPRPHLGGAPRQSANRPSHRPVPAASRSIRGPALSCAAYGNCRRARHRGRCGCRTRVPILYNRLDMHVFARI